MSRSGVEDKPAWASVPLEIRAMVANVAGSPVVRGARVYGGYSGTPTFRLLLADGRRLFFKGANPACSGFAEAALVTEISTYKGLQTELERWTPKYIADFSFGDWNVLLLEDLGPKCAPPWSRKQVEIAMRDMALFHQAMTGTTFPEALPSFEKTIEFESWPWFTDQVDEIDRISKVANSSREWLKAVEPVLSGHIRQSFSTGEPRCLIHGDLRSDNVRIIDGRLRFFDIPYLFEGLPAWDVVEFVQTIALESDFTPEEMVALYLQTNSISEAQIDSALAWYIIFFAQRAWQPEVPGLPRLRRFQRQQFAILSFWGGRRFGLPEPSWAHRLVIA